MLAVHHRPVLKSLAYIILLHIQVSAGPALRRLAREIYPEIEPETDVNQSQVCIVGDVVYGVEEPVPAEQPCLKCKCQPPGVQCEATRCASRKPGCKVVHRPNQCCPDYQCECEKDGRKYSNGERLETAPGGECKVCYCRGGEIQCTDVSCYIRNDCEGKQVPGQCCPKYEHCPTRDSVERLNNSLITSSLSNSILEESTFHRSSPNGSVLDIDANNLQNGADNGIQMELSPIQQGNSMQNPKITIQEIIPNIKEIPITPLPKTEKHQETEIRLIIEETKPTFVTEDSDEKSNNLVVTDPDAESSEITEVIQNPPTIYVDTDKYFNKGSDDLLELKGVSSTQISIITLIEASGLQRGEIDEINENTTDKEEVTSTSDTKRISEENNDLASASSSHILSLVKKKKKPSQTAKDVTTLPPMSSSAEPKLDVPSQSSPTGDSSSTSSDPAETTISPVASKAIENYTSSDHQKDAEKVYTPINTTQNPTVDGQTKILELEIEENPAYPTLPDMLTRFSDEGWMKVETSKDLNYSKSSDSESHKESKILHEILEMRSNKTIPANVSNMWLKSEKEFDEEGFVPLINLQANSPEILNTTAENNQTLDGTSEDDDFEIITTPSVSEMTDTSNQSDFSENSSTASIDLIIVSDNFNETKLANLTDWTVEQSRSVETLESSEEYSGENTTPSNKNPAPLMSEENASVEDDKKDSEVNDMLFVKEYTIDLSNDEEKKDLSGKRSMENSSDDPKSADVEMIDVSELEKNRTSTKEPEKMIALPKKIDKRDNTQIAEDEAVFAELNQELGLGSTEKPKTPEEEEIEAKKIFQELLQETSTKKPEKQLEAKTKESEALEKVGQVLAKLALRGSQPLDTGVLSVLRDFFSSQYRAYDSKAP